MHLEGEKNQLADELALFEAHSHSFDDELATLRTQVVSLQEELATSSTNVDLYRQELAAIGKERDDLAIRLNEAGGVLRERDNLVEHVLKERDGFDRANLKIEGLAKSKSENASRLASLGDEKRELLIKLGAAEGMKVEAEKNLAELDEVVKSAKKIISILERRLAELRSALENSPNDLNQILPQLAAAPKI
ncbi:homer protein homolog 1-like [Juglans microcarpa x Juglans regia]|uniref:homer protein homolog 1-like n=1 Tax=Juglans microcarpa x Juglans regia TaxID=2249226 RepID=UPI001B7E2735|nr:homer protein homolog 1-like [Juglans microcarpa x Juglans regia]